ncbi:snoRNA-binding rRNA-processing protein [Clydaea vesicula]|uniref:SnoRNA-binding rRNA-processing protein n=1 Tax=Clydaea vesicula TaxID=447962 RepID=A0AAD5U6B3_9FUNG|nr:snoRNA-binding rRNA-processing protein [Clydaea vesicula]KAJ3383990.1 snoRNA-binding rRNA-processing protein [Lobulomyces angularis]
MSDYKPTIINKYQTINKTSESRYWRSFKNPILVNHLASINNIAFNPINPNQYAISTNARILYYNNNQVKKTISRFKDTVFYCSFRSDGKVILGCDGTGLIQLFDTESRSILRSLKGHEAPCRVAKFSSNLNIFSAGDDKTIRYWDVPTETCIKRYDGHQDYIRTGVISTNNPHLFISGSYDHTIKIWDSRTSECQATFNHNQPVESVLMLPGGGLIASAGGNQIKIWDVLNAVGGSQHQPIQTLSNHQKTVTAMCLDGSNSRILSGGLDHHVKVYGLEDFKVLHSVKYPAPILSICLSPDDTRLIVGMSTGLVSIRQRQVKPQEALLGNQKKEKLRNGSYKYFMRGASHKEDELDIWVESKKSKNLKKFDKFLKKFQYGDALDSVLNTRNQSPVIIVSLLQELIHRDALKLALSNRDDVSLEPIAKFLKKYISNSRFSPLLIDVTNVILDMYSSVINQSVIIDELFQKIMEKVKEELEVHEKLLECLGIMDLVFNISSRA